MLKLNLKKSSSALATFQVPSSHLWLLTVVLDCSDKEHFHHFQKIQLDSAGIGNGFLPLIAVVFLTCPEITEIKVKLQADNQNLHICPQPKNLRTLEQMVQRQTMVHPRLSSPS